MRSATTGDGAALVCSPIAFMANVSAAAIPSFVALEHHALTCRSGRACHGLDEPLIEEGYVRVLEKPGLGVDLNLEGIRENLRWPGELFCPPRSGTRPS